MRQGKSLQATHDNAVGDDKSHINRQLLAYIVGKGLQELVNQDDQGGNNNKLHDDTDAVGDALSQQRDNEIRQRRHNRH